MNENTEDQLVSEQSARTADATDLRRIRAICGALPEVEEAELQNRPLFRVNRRRFAIYNGDDAPARPRWAGAGRSIHLLTDPSEREALAQDGRFSPSPHHGDRGWVALRLDRGEVDWAELAELLESGYRQAAPQRLVELLDRGD
jgi:predicted DNA-binding protein (MmcQ/YjbR family)